MVRMQELNASLRETVSMAALFDNRIEVVAVIESPQTIRMSNVVGHIVPPNASSLGKVITAFQSQEQREKLLRSYGFWRFTERSITDRDKNTTRIQPGAGRKVRHRPRRVCARWDLLWCSVLQRRREVNIALSASVPKMRVRDQDHEKAIVALCAPRRKRSPWTSAPPKCRRRSVRRAAAAGVIALRSDKGTFTAGKEMNDVGDFLRLTRTPHGIRSVMYATCSGVS